MKIHRPIKKWSSIFLTATCIAGSMAMMRQEVLNEEYVKKTEIEAEEAKERYLVEKLENLKRETIAKEKIRIASEEVETILNRSKKEEQNQKIEFYTWVNEKNQNKLAGIIAACVFIVSLILYLSRKKKNIHKNQFVSFVDNKQKTDEGNLYREFVNMLGGDKGAAERLINMEKEITPSETRIQSIKAAIYRLRRDMK